MATLVNTIHNTFLTKNGNIFVNLCSCGAFFSPSGKFLRWVYIDELVHLIGGTPRWISTSSNLGFIEHNLEDVEGVLIPIENLNFDIPEIPEDSFKVIAEYNSTDRTNYLLENLLGEQKEGYIDWEVEKDNPQIIYYE